MNQANIQAHFLRNIDIRGICEHNYSLKTYDNVPITKILIANIDSTTPYKLLVNTFAKYGSIIHCILKTQKQVNRNRRPQNLWQFEAGSQSQKSYAFITYSTANEAQSAIQAGFKRQIIIKRHYLRVIPANSWNQLDNPDSYNTTGICYLCYDRVLKTYPDITSKNVYINYSIKDGSLINTLNNDCLRHIINFLPFYDRVRIERVCQRWKMISKEAWKDQRTLNLNPVNWGFKSSKELFLTDPDACSIYKILKKCHPYLTSIDLSKFSSQLGSSILIELSKMCPKIKSINLRNLGFSHSEIKALALRCLNLKSIIIGYTSNIEKFDNQLSQLFSSNQNLQQIDINCFIIDGYCLKHLPRKSIQKITLRNCYSIISNNTYKIIKKFPNLQVLKIICAPLESELYFDFIKSVCLCTTLEAIQLPTLRYPQIYEPNFPALKPLTELKNLTTINVRRNSIVGDEFLQVLTRKCPNLRSVDISDCYHLTNLGVDSVTSLPNLEYLCMDRLFYVTDNVFYKSMQNLKILLCSGCINLRSLGFSMVLQSSNKLEILDLSFCQTIGNECVVEAYKICRESKWRCLKIYFEGTSINLSNIDMSECRNFLQLFKTVRPLEENSEAEEMHFFN
ncbi:F-box/LRR-repeat protein 7-like [Phymastichus coffea]|uniref:F-box/LRR-repeat protein 7-like n=1 Tax=Phymastichus coffea TaxID=108790 RepID=UPI00273AE494|nr:F-box/LRR-repeat protein 7-like [Phymastichus coffea]